MKFGKNSGFGVVAIILAILIIGTLGFVGWRFGDANKVRQNDQETNQSKGNDERIDPIKPSEEVSLLNGQLKTQAPTGWSKSSEGQLRKKIDSKTYVAEFQLTDTDYLTGNYAGNMSINQRTKTAKKTQIFIIKTVNGYISISSCEPSDQKACSLRLNGRPLFILLHAYQQGDQYARELNFEDPYTIQVVKEFVAIAEGLNL